MAETAVTGLPAPRAARLRQPSWRDWRLLVGVLLVLVSVAGGSRLVAAADDTTPVYAARSALTAGALLTPQVLTVVRVHHDGSVAGYLPATASPPAGAVVLRTVGPGELVPLSAVGSPSQLSVRPITVPLDDAPPAGLSPGALVDVWASPRLPTSGGAAYGTPKRLAAGVEISAVGSATSALSARRSVPVQVMVPEGLVATMLDALANGARTVLVPVPGGAGDRASR